MPIMIYPYGGAAGPPGPPGASTPKAATFVVSPIPGVGDFLTIEAAVAAAPVEGADIYVREGVYAPVGTILLPDDRAINIRGAGVGIAKITMPSGVPLFAVQPSATVEYTFSGFEATGDNSPGQSLASIDAAVDCYFEDIEVSDALEIVLTTSTPTVLFENCHFEMTGPLNSWSFWDGSAGGKLAWSYVTANFSNASNNAIVGEPDWNVTDSYIGGPAGQSIFGVKTIVWQGFRLDRADVRIAGQNSRVVNLQGIDVTLKVRASKFALANSIFSNSATTADHVRINDFAVVGFKDVTITGCVFDGGGLGIRAMSADAAEGVVIDGCTFKNFTSESILLSGSTGAIVGCSFTAPASPLAVVENATCQFRYDDNTGINPSTFVSNLSTINGVQRFRKSGGVTTPVFVTQFTHQNPAGLVGIGTIKNTGGVEDLEVQETVTDAFGVTDSTTITTVPPGMDYPLDLQTFFGAARPPYVSYAVAVRHPVALTNFDIQHSDSGSQT